MQKKRANHVGIGLRHNQNTDFNQQSEKRFAEASLGDCIPLTEKQARYEQIDAIKADVIAQITAEDEEISEGKIVDNFHRT